MSRQCITRSSRCSPLSSGEKSPKKPCPLPPHLAMPPPKVPGVAAQRDNQPSLLQSRRRGSGVDLSFSSAALMHRCSFASRRAGAVRLAEAPSPQGQPDRGGRGGGFLGGERGTFQQTSKKTRVVRKDAQELVSQVKVQTSI